MCIFFIFVDIGNKIFWFDEFVSRFNFVVDYVGDINIDIYKFFCKFCVGIY